MYYRKYFQSGKTGRLKGVKTQLRRVLFKLIAVHSVQFQRPFREP